MRLNEKSFVVAVAAVLVAAVVAVVLLMGSDDGGGDDDDAESPVVLEGNAAESLAGGPDEVLLLSGTSLVRQTIESPTQEVVKNVKTPSVYAAPGSTWVAYVKESKGRGGDDDFAGSPELVLYDTASEEKTKVGAGVAPVWDRRGEYVAFLQPIEPRNCVAEECSGDVRLGIHGIDTGETSTYLDGGTYAILGWAGAHVIVSDFSTPDQLTAVSLSGDTTTLEFPATQYWDASPDGRWLIKTNDRKTEFVEFSGGELGEERVPVELGDVQLMEGTWSHDSEQVAAVVASGGRPGDSSVVTFSPDDPEPVTVEESFAAVGGVFWSTDNESLLFGRLADRRQSLIQAVWCPVGNRGDCRSVISWTEGITLLRTE